VLPAAFRAQYTRPLVLGTRCHMLAMYVVLENANAMVCDYPEAYEGQPGFIFVQKVPTTWDETRVLQASPDEFLVIARRKGETWWVGGISGNTSRTLKTSFLFLQDGNWKAEIYQDDLQTPLNPNGVLIKSVSVRDSSVLELPMAAGGGFTMKLVKQ
jgi:alpha-glucosidase